MSAFVAGFILAGLVAGVSYYEGRTGGPQSFFDTFRSAMEHLPQPAHEQSSASQPGFVLVPVSEQFGSGWEITNENETPLIINAVGYNGEFKATCAEVNPLGWLLITNLKPLPVTLRIGETQAFLQQGQGLQKYSYPRDVVFIDIYTNRGNFRFRHEMLTDETPAFDADRLAEVDKEMAVIAQKVDADQKAIDDRQKKVKEDSDEWEREHGIHNDQPPPQQ